MDMKYEIEIKEEPEDPMENDGMDDQIYAISGLQEIFDESYDTNSDLKNEIKTEVESELHYIPDFLIVQNHTENDVLEGKSSSESDHLKFKNEIKRTENDDQKEFNCSNCDSTFESEDELEQPPANTVQFLKSITFSSLTIHEKVGIKKNGRPTPSLNIEEIGKSRNNKYVRKFNPGIYDKYDWICGCELNNSLFCFPCLLFGGDGEWTTNGISDLKNLQPKIIRHQNSQKHLNNLLNLSFLGKVNVADKKCEDCRQLIDRQNELVKKNRAVLSKIIDCILFCGKFELPLLGPDESSQNSGVFHGLIDFLCKLDTSFESHFQTATVFKGTLKMIQDELLDSILFICKINLKDEIKNADFLSVMCDETTDINNKSQMAIVFRYVVKGKVVERFWGFFNRPDLTREALSEILLNELNSLLSDKEKLIAQSYNGAASLSEKEGVQTRIKEVYKNAHYVHCYAHQLNLVIEKATSKIRKVRVFFNSLSGIPEFFSNSPQRTAELEKHAHRIPLLSAASFNLKNWTVNDVYERKDELIQCCSVLKNSQSKATGFAAAGIIRMLNDPEFNFWLELFSKVMPQVEILFAYFQSRSIEPKKAQSCIKNFITAIEKIKNKYKNISEEGNLYWKNKKRKFSNIQEAAIVVYVCNVIIQECTDRFTFTDHLESSKLLLRNCFASYLKDFPTAELDKAVKTYPFLDKLKLKTELSVLYSRDDIWLSDNLIDLLNVLINTNLERVFSETVKLVKIFLITPMTSIESESCFSTLNRIKTFQQNSILSERFTALAMLSVENEMINDINNFNDKVIHHFAKSKTRKKDFIFK